MDCKWIRGLDNLRDQILDSRAGHRAPSTEVGGEAAGGPLPCAPSPHHQRMPRGRVCRAGGCEGRCTDVRRAAVRGRAGCRALHYDSHVAHSQLRLRKTSHEDGAAGA